MCNPSEIVFKSESWALTATHKGIPAAVQVTVAVRMWEHRLQRWHKWVATQAPLKISHSPRSNLCCLGAPVPVSALARSELTRWAASYHTPAALTPGCYDGWARQWKQSGSPTVVKQNAPTISFVLEPSHGCRNICQIRFKAEPSTQHVRERDFAAGSRTNSPGKHAIELAPSRVVKQGDKSVHLPVQWGEPCIFNFTRNPIS